MNNSPLSAIPTFGSATLESDFDMSTYEAGKPLRGNSKRQFVRFYNHTFTEVYTTKANINEKTGSSTPVETGVREVTKEMVNIVTPGDPNIVDEYATAWHRRMFFKQYKAFRDGKTAPMGYPVEEAQFIGPSIATELKYLGCHTVEQLADASDVLCGNLANGFELRDFARSYCKAQISNKTSPQVILLHAELEKAKAEISAMRLHLDSALVDLKGQPIKTSGRKGKSDLKFTE